MNENKDSEIDKSLTPLIAQTEYQLIEKDKNALVEKIEQLDAEIHSLETAYFNISENTNLTWPANFRKAENKPSCHLFRTNFSYKKNMTKK